MLHTLLQVEFGHFENGNFYPAYCYDHDEKGVGAVDPYTVYREGNFFENDTVWRIVKNGYPNNPMGLGENEAYAVTQYAIYCVTNQMRLDYFRADSTDATAVKMLAELNNLVNIRTIWRRNSK